MSDTCVRPLFVATPGSKLSSQHKDKLNYSCKSETYACGGSIHYLVSERVTTLSHPHSTSLVHSVQVLFDQVLFDQGLF